MDKGNLLLGFGAGLIVAAGVFSLIPVQANPASATLSPDQMKRAAEEMGLVLLTKKDYQALKDAPKAEATSTAVTLPASPASPQPTAQPDATASSTPVPPAVPKAQQGSIPAQPQAPRVVSVTIPYAATAESVEKLLVKAGVLPRENRLIETLRHHDKLNRIRVGTYGLTPGMPEEEIMKRITTPPKN